MNIRLVVDVEANFTGGKFAARDEIVEQLKEDIQDPGTLSVNEGEYEIANFSVDELPEGHCDPEIHNAILKLLQSLHTDATFKNYSKRTAKLRRLLGIAS